MSALLRPGLARRVILFALPFALFLELLFPATSEAHAILLRSNPAADAVLTSAPSQVQMWFSEALNPSTSTARVLTPSRQRVDASDVHVASDNALEMDLSLQANLQPGVYIVLWRTQSAIDGHVLTGSFIFSIAQADGTVPKYQGTLPGTDILGGSSAASGGQLDGTALFSLIMVTLVDLGVVFWVGAQLWRSFVLQLSTTENRQQQEQQTIDRHVERRFDRLFSLPILLMLFLANMGVLVGQGLSLSGGQWLQAFSPALLRGLIANGSFGIYWSVREIVVVLAAALTLYVVFSRQRSRIFDEVIQWIYLILAMTLLIAVTLSGHAAAVPNTILVYAVLSDWLHLLAASLWIGGMMYLSVVYLPVLRDQLTQERTRTLLTILSHFSPLAIVGVIIMAVTGPFNAVVHIDTVNQLISTAYGRSLVVKVLLVGALLLTSAIHVGLLRPRLAKNLQRLTTANDAAKARVEQTTDESGASTAQQLKNLEGEIARQSKTLTRILRWEPLLGIGVLVCTGLMNVFAGTLLPPAIPTSSQQTSTTSTATVKPLNITSTTSDKQFSIKLTVSPNRFGTNVFTVTVLDSNGKQDTNVGVSIYTTMLDMDMGTDAVNLQPDGKGHFSASGDLSMSGNWQLRIEIRSPDFKLHESTVKIFTPF